MNLLLIVFVIAMLFLVTLLMFYIRASKNVKVVVADKVTLQSLLLTVQQGMVELLQEEDKTLVTVDEWDASYYRKKKIKNALKECTYGTESSKILIKDLIKTIISRELTEDSIDDVVNFNAFDLEPMIKFEMLLQYLKPIHGKATIAYIVDKYNLDIVKYEIEEGKIPSYSFTESDLDFVYNSEMDSTVIDYKFKLELLSTLIYQQYKGFGCIDTLREFDIDGINCGVSGSIIRTDIPPEKRATRSVWVYFRGNHIHFSFLDFGTQEELRRVVQLLIRHGSPGPLTEKRGFLVSSMYDKSRVTAFRPPAAEYWAVFIRKFTLPNVNLNYLLNPKLRIKHDDGEVEERPKYHNVDLISNTIKYLMKGQVTTGFTGRQGCGKTSLMTGCVAEIDGRLNIRTIEMAFELYLRELYPERNILSLQQTQYVSATSEQDALKKSDGSVTIVGEIATDEVAAQAIQAAQTASLFTFFSHHANTAKDLVYALRNSLVNAGGFNNSLTAEQQVVDVVHIDVHLNKDEAGNRYIERVTEIIKLDDSEDYPEIDPNNIELSMARVTREYYYRQTDRTCFKTVPILHFDYATKTYVADNPISAPVLKHMLNCMPDEDKKNFISFISKYWGDKL